MAFGNMMKSAVKSRNRTKSIGVEKSLPSSAALSHYCILLISPPASLPHSFPKFSPFHSIPAFLSAGSAMLLRPSAALAFVTLFFFIITLTRSF